MKFFNLNKFGLEKFVYSNDEIQKFKKLSEMKNPDSIVEFKAHFDMHKTVMEELKALKTQVLELEPNRICKGVTNYTINRNQTREQAVERFFTDISRGADENLAPLRDQRNVPKNLISIIEEKVSSLELEEKGLSYQRSHGLPSANSDIRAINEQSIESLNVFIQEKLKSTPVVVNSAYDTAVSRFVEVFNPTDLNTINELSKICNLSDSCTLLVNLVTAERFCCFLGLSTFFTLYRYLVNEVNFRSFLKDIVVASTKKLYTSWTLLKHKTVWEKPVLSISGFVGSFSLTVLGLLKKGFYTAVPKIAVPVIKDLTLVDHTVGASRIVFGGLGSIFGAMVDSFRRSAWAENSITFERVKIVCTGLVQSIKTGWET